MTKTRAELARQIGELEADMPKLFERIEPLSRLEAIAAEGEVIASQAGGDDEAYVYDRIEDLLRRHGLIDA